MFAERHLPGGRWRAAAAASLLALAAAGPANAGLFDDDEARRAILDLRQKLEQSNEQQRLKQAELNNQMMDQIGQLRRSLLDLNQQLDLLRADNARLRGQDEQRTRDLSELQRSQQGVDERLRKFEPQKVQLDGLEFQVERDERRQYDEAMALMRNGDFTGAANGLIALQKRYPTSGYTASALFWQGNAHYAKREYKEAMVAFRTLVKNSPDHARAPEALLSIANCQAELKDTKAARKTLDELLKAYPNSEAAQAGRERIAALK